MCARDGIRAGSPRGEPVFALVGNLSEKLHNYTLAKRDKICIIIYWRILATEINRPWPKSIRR